MLLALAICLCACGVHWPGYQSQPGKKPREALLTAMEARRDARTYRSKMSQTSSLGSTNMEVDYVAPDRYRSVGGMTMADRSSGNVEMIVIGNDSYVKAPDGNWQREKLDPNKTELYRARDEMLIENLTRAPDSAVTFAGRDELEGRPMFVFQHAFGGAPGIPATSRTKTWVGVRDGFPYKIEIEARVNNNGKEFSIKTTTTYSDYNADITIEPPTQ